jgi:hypothetical protein
MIDPDHLAMLACSSITPEHAATRGYQTITSENAATLADINIVRPGRRTPGLLVPQLRSDGSTWGYQYRPDDPRLRDGKPVKYETPWQQSNGLDVPPGVGELLGDPAVPLWITEGVKKADCGALHGLCIVALSGVWCWLHTNSAGGKMALPDWRDVALNGGRRVILAFDGDVARNPCVQKAMHALSQYLAYKGALVEYLWLPDTDHKTGLDDYLMAGHTVDDLWRLVKPTPPPPAPVNNSHSAPTPPEPAPEPVQPVTLEKLHQRCLHWFGEHYDLDAIDATLATAAAELLTGDPLWLLIISGPGALKTETIITLEDRDRNVIVTSTISSIGALLSATAQKERAADATGGLLKTLEPRGVLILKDMTSILSLPPGIRAPILAAFREIYDGRWVREAGVDGGRRIPWKGRIAVLGACTTAWDRAHAVISEMGDRFVLLRIDSTIHRLDSGSHAIENTGTETQMRAELNLLARGVIAGIDTATVPQLDKDDKRRILRAANLVTLARTAVDHDYRGDVIDAHAPELPTRFGKQLTQVFRGAVIIGLTRQAALRLAIRCARDSMPPLRLEIIDDLAENPDATTADIRKRLHTPRNTVDRQLQAMQILRVVDVDEDRRNQYGTVEWHYSLAADIDPGCLTVPKLADRLAVPEIYISATDTEEEEREQEDNTSTHPPTYISGHAPDAAADAAYRGGKCIDCKERDHSPGRPRCDECHRIWLTLIDGYDR